jgi:HEAT repeat protein
MTPLSDLFILPLQSGAWRVDALSFMMGVMLGAGLTLGVYRLLPVVRRWQEQVVGRVRDTHAWVRSGVEHRFQAETAAYVQQRHLDGHRLRLDQIFVEPPIRAPEAEPEPEAGTDHDPAQLQYLWPELTRGTALPPGPAMTIRRLLLAGRRFALVAEGGAGKSTLLAYCAHLCATATDTGPFTFLLPVVPVFVHLGEVDLAAGSAEPGEEATSPGAETNEPAGPPQPADPLLPLTRALQLRSGPLTSAGVEGLLRQKFASGHVLLLLDGLDELPADARQPVFDWLALLVGRYPQIQLLVAAPLSGYGFLLDLDFAPVGLLAGRAAWSNQLAEQWATGLDQEKVPLRRFWRPGQLPLVTALRLGQEHQAVEGAHQGTAARPSRLLDLLETSLCQRLPQGENQPVWLAPATRELWQQIGFQLLADRCAHLSRTELLGMIEKVLVPYEVEERGAATLLQGTLSKNGLFLTWPDQSLSLISPVWRDFLAAAYLAQMQQHEVVRENLLDPFWAGAVRFFVGRVGAAAWVTPLLESKAPDPFHELLFQAASWMAEAPDEGEWRRQIMIRLGQTVIKANIPLVLRQRAALALAQTGETGVLAFLRQLLRQTDPALRQTAIAGLARQEAEVCLELLEKMMTDAEPAVRRIATHVLAWWDDPIAEKPLLMALLDRDEALHRAAAEGLALSGGDSLEILKEALTEDELHVRRAAVHGLSFIDQHWVTEALEKAIREDEQWVIKASATEALESIAARNRRSEWQRPRAGDQPWLIAWAVAQGRAVPGGAAAMPVLQEVLAGADKPAIRAIAAATIGRLAARETVPALRAALRDSDAQVREAAFLSLCRIHRAYDINT